MPARSKTVSTVIIAAVFAANLVETAIEDHLGLGREQRARAAHTFQSIEGGEFFLNHDLTSVIAVYGYTFSYFFVFLLGSLAIAVALALREDGRQYRVLSLAVAINYLVSLPFFIFFPVPERWTHAEGGALLLSDLWSSSFIEMLRPVSGLDNCFPSTHCSLTVTLILMAYLARLKVRTPVLALGLTIILSTFVLGIHWLPDMAAGISVGVLSVLLARRLEMRGQVDPAPAAGFGRLAEGGV